MKTSPRPLLVLHPDRVLHERLMRIAQRRFILDLVEDWDELHARVSEAPPAAVVLVDPYYGQTNGGGPSPHLYNILKSFPSSTVIAAMDTPPEQHRDIWLLGDWGVAEIFQTDEDKSQEALRRRVMTARGQPLRRLLAHDPGFALTGRARALLDAAVETVMNGGHPKDLARTLAFSPSTLLRWCHRSQLPNPRRLLLWMRILFASALLDDPGHTVFSVGVACGYSGDQALRRAIRSVVPYTPTELRELGAFETVSQAFWAELAELRDDEADKR
jgi:AraC-like DNA-binding protein